MTHVILISTLIFYQPPPWLSPNFFTPQTPPPLWTLTPLSSSLSHHFHHCERHSFRLHCYAIFCQESCNLGGIFPVVDDVAQARESTPLAESRLWLMNPHFTSLYAVHCLLNKRPKCFSFQPKCLGKPWNICVFLYSRMYWNIYFFCHHPLVV